MVMLTAAFGVLLRASNTVGTKRLAGGIANVSFHYFIIIFYVILNYQERLILNWFYRL